MMWTLQKGARCFIVESSQPLKHLVGTYLLMGITLLISE